MQAVIIMTGAVAKNGFFFSVHNSLPEVRIILLPLKDTQEPKSNRISTL
jgi:hypothetical protein